MIVTCPHCSARFRVADEKLDGKRLSLRCSRCRKTFPAAAPPAESAAASPVQAPEGRSDGYVLVAHSDPDLCRTIGALLSRDGIAHEVVDDGDSALSLMSRRPPRAIVVDVALPGLYAFEVVDKVRSRPGLQGVKIILLSSVYNKMAYKCQPRSLYGADDYIEKHHLPDSLVDKIRQLCPAQAPVASVSAPTRSDTQDDWEEVNESIRQAEEREVTATDRSKAVEKARRLARIIVSDIALYNQERVEAGIAEDRFRDEFAQEIAEAKQVFAARVAADLRDREDFLMDAFTEFISRRQQELGR